MLRLRRTINKLELAIKSSKYFYSHQFMKFHGQIQKIYTHTHNLHMVQDKYGPSGAKFGS